MHFVLSHLLSSRRVFLNRSKVVLDSSDSSSCGVFWYCCLGKHSVWLDFALSFAVMLPEVVPLSEALALRAEIAELKAQNARLKEVLIKVNDARNRLRAERKKWYEDTTPPTDWTSCASGCKLSRQHNWTTSKHVFKRN